MTRMCLYSPHFCLTRWCTRGNIEKATIDKFKFLERLKTSITVNGSEEDDSILDFFFPNFVLTLRDVTLNTKAKDDDAFLEEKLILSRDKNANKEALEEYNLPRKLIRRYFKQRKCFRFIQPIETNRLKELMTLDESTLEKEFKQKLDEFRSHIFSCKPKSLKSGKAINGRMFCTLVLNYVHSIRAGDPPCLISAMVSMAAVENTYVSKRASEIYKAEMQRRIASHIPSEKGLVNYHKDCMCAALEVLKDGLIIDDQQIYEEQAIACFEDQLEKFKIIVKKHTDSECWELLERIDRMKIQLKIKNRKYCTPTGYDDYMADIDSLIKQFNREAGYMGSVAMSALQDFLAKKSTEEEEVYKLVQDALNGKEGPERRNMKSLLREDDAKIQKEEEKIEEAIRADIEMLQKDGQQSIGEQYFDMLTSKIEEVDRVKNELGRNNLHYKNLCKETAHWKNVFENAPFSLSHYRRQLKPVGGQQADMQATVTEEQRASPEGTEAIEDYSDSSQSCGHNKQDVKEQTKCKIL